MAGLASPASSAARPPRRWRMPLAFVVGRYFVYLLLGACLTVGGPALALMRALSAGQVLPANYGANHVQAVSDEVLAQQTFDSSAIPSSYWYAHLSADGKEVLETDMPGQRLAHAKALARTGSDPAGSDAEGDALHAEAGFSFTGGTRSDGTWVVLAYTMMPQWSSRAQRDSLPNPQDILLAVMGASTLALVAAVAIRASRVLTRKMAPLVAAADAVAASDLDVPVGMSNVTQVDDVLKAMERMRVSLKDSLEARWAAEEDRRRHMEALMHELKTPLTAIQGNAELLADDLAAGRLSGEAATDAREIIDAAHRMDESLVRIIGAWREIDRG